MIRPGDAILLAATKLRARKVRTIFTIVIAGLLFGLVAGIIIVSDGALGSAERLTKESMTGRYIVSGMSMQNTDTFGYYTDATLVAKAQTEYTKLIADKKAEAKRLGIEYDASQDMNPVQTTDGTKSLNTASPIAQRLLNEKALEQSAGYQFEDFQKLSSTYSPIGVYKTTMVHAKDGALTEMKKGVETFTSTAADTTTMSSGASPDVNEQQIVPEVLVSNYIIKNNTWKPENGTIPVIVSLKRAATMTGMSAPSSEASASTRLSYVNDIRKQALGKTFTVCYRNSVSQAQITEAVATAKEIESHKNDKTYQKPSLIYGTPDPSSCGQAPVTRDVRTSDEKALTEKTLAFKRTFGETVDPLQTKLTYEVVGVAPNTWADTDMSFGYNVKDIVMSMFMTSGFRMAIPAEMYDRVANKATYANALSENSPLEQQYGFGTYYAEFSSADAARTFAKNESCQFAMSGCEPKDKHFYIAPFGSNSIALDDARRAITTATLWIIAVVTLLAAVIAGLTIGRTIADGRRETAVFRAIGFKRFDIGGVYATYTLLLSSLVALFAVGAGLCIALVVNHSLWLDTTVQAQLALGIFDSSQRFSYIAFSWRLLLVVLAALLAGALGMLLPLLRNVRRNPIRDMRDE